MSKNLPNYDLFESRAARDAAITLGAGHNLRWIDHALVAGNALPVGWIGTGEDIRRVVDAVVQPGPKHHNAWGALISTLIKRRVLIKTGVYVNMKQKSSHARSTPQYVRNG